MCPLVKTFKYLKTYCDKSDTMFPAWAQLKKTFKEHNHLYMYVIHEELVTFYK